MGSVYFVSNASQTLLSRAMLRFLPFMTDALSSLLLAFAEGDGDASSETGRRSLILSLLIVMRREGD